MIYETQISEMTQTSTKATQGHGGPVRPLTRRTRGLGQRKTRRGRKAAATYLTDEQQKQVVEGLKDENHDLLYNKRR